MRNARDQKRAAGVRIYSRDQTTHIFPQFCQADKDTASGLNLGNDERIVQTNMLFLNFPAQFDTPQQHEPCRLLLARFV